VTLGRFDRVVGRHISGPGRLAGRVRFDFAIKIRESAGGGPESGAGTREKRWDFIINEILIIPALACFVIGQDWR
jgi:hypothetical protein